MTDDLMAMVAPTDGDQIVRRCDGPVTGQPPAATHRVHGALFFPVRDMSFLPIPNASRLDAAVEIHCSYCFERQGMQGRAPPTTV